LMAVACPVCGSVSHDREFCDRCNADLMPPSALPPPDTCPLAPDHPLRLTHQQNAFLSRPERSITVSHQDKGWRLHWIPLPHWPQWHPLVEERLRYRLSCLPPCRLMPDRDGVWIAAEADGHAPAPWVEADRLDPLNRLRQLAAFLDVLCPALEELHAAGFLWLTFDPQALEQADGRLRFTNLDLRVYPAGRCPDRLEIVPAYAAPEVCRFQEAVLGPHTDVFHLAMFAYYWMARYLPHGFFGRGLEAFLFNAPPLQTFVPGLPPGIAAVLERGRAINPADRFPTVTAFHAALRTALEQVERRRQAAAVLHWELGFCTRAGRAKDALGRANEDYALVRSLPSPERALVAVADGISSCDVGSGVLASRMVCETIETILTPDCRADTFPERIDAACLQGARSLLDWALEHGERLRLLAGQQLMGTTLTAAWLEGSSLTLANLGDSRAYLIHETGIDQLTVDGDLGSALLAAGAPPEEVMQLGNLSKALHDCVGGCCQTPAGALTVDEDHCRPAFSRWPLVPGDIVILCTDGLIEEGAFLHPAEVAELVRQNRTLSALALAETLVEAADARQRLPSPSEPDGFGDNITCAVIKLCQKPSPCAGN
jgi:serine/threonine protein phosphatase PrpC